MATKINQIQQIVHPDALLLSSWLEKQGLGRAEQTKCVRNGWLVRVSTGVYSLTIGNPTLYSALYSYGMEANQSYHIGASSALEMKGYTHYVSMGKPQAFVFTPLNDRLPKWFSMHEWNMTLHETSTKVFGDEGVETLTYNGFTLQVSSPERAIMECMLLSPTYYNLMDVYYLMEMLTTLRSKLVSELLRSCTSVKVKRLFLYMAEKAGHQWFSRLDLTDVGLGSGPRSFAVGGVKDKKYNIVIPRELAIYE
jgi:predicted transcriptional regulator of viral defense system